MAAKRTDSAAVRPTGQVHTPQIDPIRAPPAMQPAPMLNLSFPAFPQFPSGAEAHLMAARQADQFANTAMTVFDLTSRIHDDMAVRQAREDAPALIKYDGQGMLVPVQSFTPSGFTSRAYRQTYEDTAKAIYMQTAAQEFGNHAAVLQKSYPTDIGAVQQGLATKREAMMRDLDPSMSKLLLLRFNAIEGQALSSTNGNIAQERIAVAGQQATNALGTFIDDAAKAGVLLDKLSPEDLATNNALLGARWKEFETLARGAGWSDDRIRQTFEESRVKVYIARHEREMRKMTLDTVAGTSPLAQPIYKSLQDGNDKRPALPPAQAAAIVGGLFGESSTFDPKAVHDNGTGLGIAGWRDPRPGIGRRSDMIAEAKRQGVDPTDREFQINYFVQELQKRPEWKQFMAATTTTEAVTALMHFFQPAGYTKDNPTAGRGYETRVAFANALVSGGAAGGEQGQMDLARMVQVKQRIEAIADGAGWHAPQVRQALTGAMNEAVEMSRLRVAAFNQEETNRIQAKQVDYLKALQTSPEGGVEVRNAIRRDITATLSDSSLSDAGKLKAVAMYQSVDAMTAAQAGPFYQQQVTRLVNTAQDISQPVERQRAAINQLQEIVNDPSLTTYLPVGVRNYAETAIRQAARSQIVGDVAGFQTRTQAGDNSPEIIADQMGQLIQRGVIGDGPAAAMTIAQAQGLYTAGVKAWTEREGNRQLAAQGLERVRKTRQLPTAMEAEAIQKEYPFRTPNGGPLNLSDPVHGDKLAEYFRLTGTVPKSAKDQFANLPMGSDEATTMAMHSSYKKLYDVVRSKPGMDPANVYPYLTETIGTEAAAFLADVSKVGYENAVKFKNSDSNAKTRQLGESPAGANKSIDDAITKFVTEMPANAQKDFLGNITAGIAAETGDDTKIAQQLMTNAGQGKGFMNTVGAWLDPTDLLMTKGVTEMKMAPALRSMIAKHATFNLENNGRVLDRLGEEGARSHVVRQAMIAFKDIIDLKVGEDGKTATLGLKTWEKQTAEMLNLPGHAAPRVAYGFLRGIVQTSNPSAVYDPGSLAAKLYVTDGGERFWSITGTENGVPGPELERMRFDDPRIGKLASQINEEASRYMRKYWQGKGDGPLPEEVAFFGASAATLALNAMGNIGKVFAGPIRDDAKERLASEWADPTFVDKMLDVVGIATRNAPVGSTDWKATIANAKKNMTPAERTQFQRLDALTRSPKDRPIYFPGGSNAP